MCVWLPPTSRFFSNSESYVRPGYALSAALVVAMGTSTLLSLFWPFPPDEYKTLNMGQLASTKYGALFVWLYVLVWFLVQDAAKVLSNALLRRWTIGKGPAHNLNLSVITISVAIDAGRSS